MVRTENLHAKLASLRRTLGVQAAIDLAEMLCSFKGYGRAESMTRGFALLEAAGVISARHAESLQKMVGFRNALVHGYENLDYKIVEEALRVRIEDIEELARLIESALA